MNPWQLNVVKNQTQNWVFNVFNIMNKIIEDVDVDSGKYNKAQKSLETSVLNIPSVSGLCLCTICSAIPGMRK